MKLNLKKVTLVQYVVRHNYYYMVVGTQAIGQIFKGGPHAGPVGATVVVGHN